MHNINCNEHCQALDEKGYTIIPNLLSVDVCNELVKMYEDCSRYRSIINMQRYRFDKEECKYFCYPLPSVIKLVCEYIYRSFVHLANDWMQIKYQQWKLSKFRVEKPYTNLQL